MTKLLKASGNNDEFLSEDGYVMSREFGKTPSGNELRGRWVLRNADGAWVDFDQYRSDLAQRNGFCFPLDGEPEHEVLR
jgi:hypothetical protein